MNFQHFECRVSSVLNRDVKQYGKKYLFDENEETCWSSDQGSPQWIEVVFNEEKTISSIIIQFQGGFVGQDCIFEIKTPQASQIDHPFYPDDINTPQIFNFEKICAKSVRIVFKKSTDFFGRIVIYRLSFVNSLIF
uniref:F5/8 type C domain-containing protein n=1 Tax=Clastoptera arizonana TaxID=38151 RepID=A0A1B6D718_9HEMI